MLSLHVESHSATKLPFGWGRNGKNRSASHAKLLGRVGKKIPGVFLGVRMRDVCGLRGDFARTGETRQCGNVFRAERAKQQPCSPQFLWGCHSTGCALDGTRPHQNQVQEKRTFTSGRLSRVTVSTKRTCRSSRVTTSDCVRMPSPKNRTPRSRFPSVTPVHAKMSFFPGSRSSVR